MKPKKKIAPRKNTALARESPVPGVSKVATEIRECIEAARNHVSVAANLAMVSLYWNIGRIIALDIQKSEKRAEYGAELMEQLAVALTEDYGQGYSVHNLRDMKRFFDGFVIRQTVSADSAAFSIHSTLSNESQIVQTTSGQSQAEKIRQTASVKLTKREIRQTVSTESCDRLQIDFCKHFRLGWSHYRLLLSQGDPLRRRFYFEQAAQQRWSVRESRRQIDRGLFERVALSKDTPRLVTQEEQAGPAEVVRYEDIFKDPYVLDFLGLKGAYSEKDLEASIVRNLEQFLTELGTDFCFIARRQHVELLLRHGPHRMKVAEYMTHLPDKRLLEDRLKVYSRLLKDRECRSAESAGRHTTSFRRQVFHE